MRKLLFGVVPMILPVLKEKLPEIIKAAGVTKREVAAFLAGIATAVAVGY